MNNIYKEEFGYDMEGVSIDIKRTYSFLGYFSI